MSSAAAVRASVSRLRSAQPVNRGLAQTLMVDRRVISLCASSMFDINAVGHTGRNVLPERMRSRRRSFSLVANADCPHGL